MRLGVDLSGVAGVSPDQQLRVALLLQWTLERLPQFADVDSIGALGYRSMGDGASGHEHYINRGYMVDEHFLDPQSPESLVYRVNGEGRTLVGAMFMAPEGAVDDPALVEYGGPLMEGTSTPGCASVKERPARPARSPDESTPRGTAPMVRSKAAANDRCSTCGSSRGSAVRFQNSIASTRRRQRRRLTRQPTRAPTNTATWRRQPPRRAVPRTRVPLLRRS